MKIDTLSGIARRTHYQFNMRELWSSLGNLTSINIKKHLYQNPFSLTSSSIEKYDIKDDSSENTLNKSLISDDKTEVKFFSNEYKFKSSNYSLLPFKYNKMKKIFALIVLLSTLSTMSFAQVANLNITLSDVLSFSVTQPGSLDVNFDTEEKYTNGITALASDHVSVTSSKGYIVKAIAGTVTGLAAISPGTVKITTALGVTNTGNTTGITYGSAIILPETGGTPATVISASNSSWNGSNATNKFNISYLIGSGGAYAGKPTGLNVVPVLYTVTQQ